MSSRSYLIYDDECQFCTGIAEAVSRLVNNKNLVLFPKTLAKVTFSDIYTTYDFNKNIHLLKSYDSIMNDTRYDVFVAGSAIAEVISMRRGLSWISKLNQYMVFKVCFNIIYKVLKIVRRVYNKIQGD